MSRCHRALTMVLFAAGFADAAFAATDPVLYAHSGKTLFDGKFGKLAQKGTDPTIDSYSTFFDNGRRKSTGLEKYLRENGVTDVYIGGLATDYCVLWSARDAVELGFQTHVITDACRGVDLQQGDIERAYDEMRSIGVDVLASREIA